MTARQVIAWIQQLPPGSALDRAQNGEEAVWDLHAHLLAAVFDTLTWANYQRTDGKGQKPKPLQRPGVGPKRVARNLPDPDEARRILDGYRRGDYAKEVTDG